MPAGGRKSPETGEKPGERPRFSGICFSGGGVVYYTCMTLCPHVPRGPAGEKGENAKKRNKINKIYKEPVFL